MGNSEGQDHENDGIIPFEEPDPREVRRPAITKPPVDPASINSGSNSKCPSCGYATAGLRDNRCPECGKPFNRKPRPPAAMASAEEQLTAEYRSVLLSLAVGIAAMALAQVLNAAVSGTMGDAGFYILIRLASYVVMVPLGIIVYALLAYLWFGHDAPWGITILRLATVFAFGDAIADTLVLVPIPIFPRLLSVAAYVGLLMHFLDIEGIEAIVLGLAIAAVATAVVITAAMML